MRVARTAALTDDPRSSWLTDAVEGRAELRGRVLPRLRLRVRSRWDEARASAMRPAGEGGRLRCKVTRSRRRPWWCRGLESNDESEWDAGKMEGWRERGSGVRSLRARSPVAVAPGGQAESAASTSSIEQAATLAPRLARAPILPLPCSMACAHKPSQATPTPASAPARLLLRMRQLRVVVARAERPAFRIVAT